VDNDEIVRKVGYLESSVEAHSEGLSKIFDLLGDIKEQVDKNAVRAQYRDDRLEEISQNIKLVDKKIENGLRSEVRFIAEKVNAMVENHKNGISGFFSAGMKKFKAQLGFIIIVFGFCFGLWLLGWIVAKLGIFQEGPMWLLKMFGIGG
jgi:hypothetical protein